MKKTYSKNKLPVYIHVGVYSIVYISLYKAQKYTIELGREQSNGHQCTIGFNYFLHLLMTRKAFEDFFIDEHAWG